MKKLNTQRILLTTLVAVAFFGFLLWSIQQSQSEEEFLLNTQTLINAKNPLENEMIKITSPLINSEIKSPVTISGRIKIWDDKNIKVRIEDVKTRIKDSKGLLLKEAFIQKKDTKAVSNFSINVSYKKPSSQKGTVEVFQVSADSGSEMYKISIPVVFKD